MKPDEEISIGKAQFSMFPFWVIGMNKVPVHTGPRTEALPAFRWVSIVARRNIFSAMRAQHLCFFLCFQAIGLSSACTHYIPIQVPIEARATYTADQIVIRLNEFQTFVIDQAATNQIPTPLARQIVTWLIRVRTIIGQQPNGWQAQALTGWELLKDELARVPQLAPWVPVIDQLLSIGT